MEQITLGGIPLIVFVLRTVIFFSFLLRLLISFHSLIFFSGYECMSDICSCCLGCEFLHSFFCLRVLTGSLLLLNVYLSIIGETRVIGIFAHRSFYVIFGLLNISVKYENLSYLMMFWSTKYFS